jgi:hypothetical protein
MSTKLRITPVIDGITLPDQYFDHPNFAGQNFNVQIFAEVAPATFTQLVPTGFAATGGATGAVPLFGTTGTFSINDSRNPKQYYP